jgi:hypothetical protein
MSQPRSVHVSCVTALAIGALLLAPAARADFLFGRLMPGPATEANNASNHVDVSADGRTLVFTTLATNWAADATGPNSKIIATDLDTGVIEHVSETAAGAALSGIEPAVSRDGRYVAFRNNGGALDVGVPTSGWQVVRKDRVTGELRLVSSSAGGVASDRESRDPSISDDGRYVAFRSGAFNLGYTNTNNAYYQVYVKDVATGEIDAASRTTAGTLPDVVNGMTAHALSGDGRLVVFSNNANGMVAGLNNTGGTAHVYARDVLTDTTELITRNSNGEPADRGSDFAAISPSGRFVSFRSFAFNLGGTANSNSGVYVRDRVLGTTTPVPRPTVAGMLANGCRESDVSDIATVLLSCNFPTPMHDQVLLHIPGAAGTPFLVSSDSSDVPGDGQSGASVAMDGSGLSMAFESLAANLVDGDGNDRADIFVLVDDGLLFGIFSDGFED